jgi:hypothetical protein
MEYSLLRLIIKKIKGRTVDPLDLRMTFISDISRRSLAQLQKQLPPNAVEPCTMTQRLFPNESQDIACLGGGGEVE